MSESMDFTLKHPETGEVRIVTLTAEVIQERLSEQLVDELSCDCEPIGETNAVECNCDSYFNEFELQDRVDATEPNECPACSSTDTGASNNMAYCYQCQNEVRAESTLAAIKKWNENYTV